MELMKNIKAERFRKESALDEQQQEQTINLREEVSNDTTR